MKTKIITMIAVVVFLSTQGLQATDIEFHNDGIIQAGDDYDNVNVYDNATVDMTGGSVADFHTNASSTANLNDGEVWRFYCRDTSTFNMMGGIIHQSLGLSGSGIANLRAGSINQGISAIESSTVNVYGYNFQIIPTGNSYDLFGYWENGEAFDVYLRGPTTYPRVVLQEIPEPSGILLLSLGCLCLRR